MLDADTLITLSSIINTIAMVWIMEQQNHRHEYEDSKKPSYCHDEEEDEHEIQRS